MKVHMSRDIISGKYCATLLGGMLDNCHGIGYTEKEAMAVLKITIRIRLKR